MNSHTTVMVASHPDLWRRLIIAGGFVAAFLFFSLAARAAGPQVPWECSNYSDEAETRCLNAFIEHQREQIGKLEGQLQEQQDAVSQLKGQMDRQAATAADLQQQLSQRPVTPMAPAPYAYAYSYPYPYLYPPVGFGLYFGRPFFGPHFGYYGYYRPYWGPRFYGRWGRRW